MNLEDLQVYQTAMKIGDDIWRMVDNWPEFPRNTIGRQIVRSADSVAANISEGFGRYHYKEGRQYGYYARGSLYETRTWLMKANKRNLVDKDDFKELQFDIDTLLIKLNNYIKTIGKASTNTH
jgi:four helix bundle protein